MWNTIIGELNRISDTVEGWKKESVSEIERDIVLKRLRALYEQIKFADKQSTAQPISIDDPNPQDIAAQQTIGNIADTGTISDKEPLVAQQQVDLPLSEEAEHTEEHNLSKTRRDAIIESLYGAIADEPLTDEDIIEKEIYNETRDNEIPIDWQEVEQDEGQIDSKSDNLLIPENENKDAEQQRATSAKATAPITPIAPTAPKNGSRMESNQHSQEHTAKTVLGDVIHAHERTLGDSYAENGQKTTDVATKLGATKVTGLRKSIGINDKFLMIKELFDGDSMAFDRAIGELEHFDELDDALIHIHETYSWNPNTEGVKLLVDLLTKKLS